MSLADRIWWTRRARIRTEKRLLANAWHSQIILLWYSFFSVSVSIYYLQNPQDNQASVSWVIYSVMVLCASVFINGLSFKERASLVKACYESLSTLEAHARQLERQQDTDNASILEDISRRYESILNSCENHTSADYVVALCVERLNSPQEKLSKRPTCFQWVGAIWHMIKSLSRLLFLYLLPFIIWWINADG